MPKPRKDKKPTAKTKGLPSSFPKERKVTPLDIRTGNAVHQVEFAKNLAYVQARLKLNSNIRTKDKTYRVVREVSQGVFSYVYEVQQTGGNYFYMVTEPITNNKDMERFKLLKFELMILSHAMQTERSNTMHFPRLRDSGCTEEFKFLIMQGLGDTLYDITRNQMKSAFSTATALRVGIQMLRAIKDLHSLNFLHRSLRPHVFFVGSGSNIRTVYMGDFGLPFMFRDPRTKKIRKPRKNLRIMGTLRYMSRNAQTNQEHARRDDLEAWAYLTMEFFDLNILPWCNDQVSSEVLHKKQKTVDGKYPMIFTTMTLRFKPILCYITSMKFNERPNYDYILNILQEIHAEKKADFNLPYDWELLNKMHDGVGIDPANTDVLSKPQLPRTVTPKEEVKEKEKNVEVSVDDPSSLAPLPSSSVEPADDPSSPVDLPVASIEPAEVKSTKSITTASSCDVKVEIGINQVVLDKVIEVDMANDCVNMAENKALRSLLEKNRNKAAEKAEGNDKMRQSMNYPKK